MAERCPVVALDCRYAGKANCIVTRHHLYWPARDYETPLELAFREANIDMERRCDHDDIHREQFPPLKPTVKEMITALTVQLEKVEEHEQAA